MKLQAHQSRDAAVSLERIVRGALLRDQSGKRNVDALVIRQEAVVAVLVAQDERENQRGGQSQREARDADGRVEPPAREVTQRRRQIIAKHGDGLYGCAGARKTR